MSFLEALWSPLHRWQTMRELRALEKQETYDSRWDFKEMIEKANEALERDLRGRAKEIWGHAAARFPDLAMMSEPALDLMLKLGLYDDAEALLSRAVKRHPNSVQALEGLARLALQRGDHEEAVRRSELLRKRHPQSLKGYWIGCGSLSHLGRFKEAEATIQRGLQVAPDDLILNIEFARLAERGDNWDEALKRWMHIHDATGHPAATVGLVTTLSRLGRYDEADAMIASVAHKSGNDLGIWMASAQVAEQKQDWGEAAKRWARIRQRFPLSGIGYVCSLKPLEKLARPQEADDVIKEGTVRVPDDVNLFIEHARMADRRGDWANAAERWATVRQRFPACGEAYSREAIALDALQRPEDAASVRKMAPTRAA
jgi:tetratricopeptide (TPR) repeat protein